MGGITSRQDIESIKNIITSGKAANINFSSLYQFYKTLIHLKY